MRQNMRPELWERATKTRNEYGEEVLTFNPIGEVDIFITFAGLASDQSRGANQIEFDEFSHIALTTEKTIEKGDRIGEKYLVKYTLPSKPYYRIFLKEIR